MTLGIAWERVVGDTHELVIISDSRLSGGARTWDGCPKILTLPRSDSVISFAGNTADAYPLMLQTQNTIKLFQKAINRSLDITELKGHLIRIFNHSWSLIDGFPSNQQKPDDPEAVFLFSGYSWKEKKFKIWTLHFDSNIGRFTFRPTTPWGGQSQGAHKLAAFVGDEDAVAEAKRRLVTLLKDRGKIDVGSFDMEPFEVLRDIIREELFHHVGGAPQMYKVYEHSNVARFGAYWPDKASKTICVHGRPLMHYETPNCGIIDPDDPSNTLTI